MTQAFDIIKIQNIRAEALIGIYPQEREEKQPIIVDIEFATDAEKIANSDNIEAAVNYRSVSEHITQHIESSEYQLIETLAHQLATNVQTTFQIPWLRLTVQKPQAMSAENQDISITLERSIAS